MHNFTPAQNAAIHTHDRNLIVVAGAGSGKTFVLVERFLALLDRNPDWPLNALVAITFTKKAAQEMRDRVRQELDRRYQQAGSIEDRERWTKHIAAIDSARIDTIHGLCASILRANAAEAGIDPGFEVLDETEAQLLLDDAIDQALETAVQHDRYLAPLFTEYEERTIRQALRDFIAVEMPVVPDDLFEQWQADWERTAGEALEALRHDPIYIAVAHWIPPGGWPKAPDKLFDVWLQCWDLLAVIDRDSDLESRKRALSELAQIIKVNVGSAANWGGKETLDAAKQALKQIRAQALAVLEAIGERPDSTDRKTAKRLPLWVSLVQHTRDVYWQKKQIDGLLDFNDLERLTRKLLQEHPAVRARYRNTEFKHILVDEFQDTNAVQWDIVRELAGLERHGSLFVVGDPKQSIYAFRGADVSVFDQVRGMILEQGGGEIPLTCSFRAHQTLVEGFNYLFRQILRQDTNSPVSPYEVEFGQPLEAFRIEAPSSAPPLEFILIGGEQLEDNSAENRRRWEACEVAQRIHHMVMHEARPIYDKHIGSHRPMRYGDVAILFQSMSHVTHYEDVFKALSLPFVTVAGRGYYSRQEVWDVLNLLTALHNPADDLALATVLRSPLFGLSDDALLALRLQLGEQGERLSLWEALYRPGELPERESTVVSFASNCLRRLRSLAGRVTIAELLRAALDETGYLAVLTGLPDGARRRGNVEKLLEKAETSGQVTLGAFSQYLRDLTAREIREGEARVETGNAVTLMTVHAGKGLEFPLVVLVDAGWNRSHNDTGSILLEPRYGLACKIYDADEDRLASGYAYQQAKRLRERREIAERKRLLYVAATRAQDYLIISGQLPSNQDGAWKNNTWLGWLWQALEFDGRQFASGQKILDSYSCGQVRVSLPDVVPTELDRTYADDQSSAWHIHDVVEGIPVGVSNEVPALLRTIPPNPQSYPRHIAATQIADLGSKGIEPFYGRKFRHSILHDAPDAVDRVSRRNREDVSRRIIGEMVHRVLGRWHVLERPQDLPKILESYAWELGVVDIGQRSYAIQEAGVLLQRTQQSQLFGWLKSARRVYRELPFVYRTDRRIIHGILDVLFQRQDGSWAVVDYKTSFVGGGTPSEKLVSEHARRYHLQIGVYTAAAAEQLGVTPEAFIYYIRYGLTIPIHTEAWQSALSKLEDDIGDVLRA
jgi:ATP-dependent helicase/nuclease subunit A